MPQATAAGRIEALQTVVRYVAPEIARALLALPRETQSKVEEVRLRAGQPLGITGSMGEPFVTPAGMPTCEPGRALAVTATAVRSTLERMAGYSLYTLEEELRQGFLTLPGGHRVGFTGHAVVRDGRLHALKWVATLDIRLATALEGNALGVVLPRLLDGEGGIRSTLLVAPPRAGKTTLLRELVRLVSTGVPDLGVRGQAVGVVDERSELGGASEGVPTLDLGPRTDLLDACPKAEGLFLLVRAMAPRLLATDEIGRREDALALLEAATAGVRVLATAHARSMAELEGRPSLAALWPERIVERFVLLSRRRGPGTVERVVDADGKDVAWPEARAGRPA